MLPQFLATFFTIILFEWSSTAAFKSYKGYKLIQVIPQDESQLNSLSFMKNTTKFDDERQSAHVLEFWREPNAVNQTAEILVSPQAAPNLTSFLRSQGFRSQTTIRDVGSVIADDLCRPSYRKSGALKAETFNAVDDPSLFDLNQYHSYKEISNYLKSIACAHSDFVYIGSLGNSFEKLKLTYLKIGYPTGRNKKALFIDAGFHARECIAPAVALHFINHLIRMESRDLLKDIDIYVLPLVNPDGYEYSREVDRMWRKTRSGPHNGCFGADPNRNFPYHWCTTGASHKPCSYQDYCGMKPLSESECRNLANFLITNKNNILAYITLHSYGNMIIHPFGDRQNSYPHNVAELKDVGEKAKAAIVNAGGPKYHLGTTMEVIRYTASGSSFDFAKSIGIRYSYTMELTDTVYGFLLPSKYINATAQHILPALMVFAEEVQTVARQGSKSS